MSIKRITNIENISPIFLEQIFTKLKKSGLIHSVRGAGGGFLLARKADEITVMDILDAVEEGVRLTPCCAGGSVPQCTRIRECHTMEFWNDANEHFVEYLENYTLAKVIAEYTLKERPNPSPQTS